MSKVVDILAAERIAHGKNPTPQSLHNIHILERLELEEWTIDITPGLVEDQHLIRTYGLHEKLGGELQRLFVCDGSELSSQAGKWKSDITAALTHEDPLRRLQETSGCMRLQTSLHLQLPIYETPVTVYHYSYMLDPVTTQDAECEWLRTYRNCTTDKWLHEHPGDLAVVTAHPLREMCVKTSLPAKDICDLEYDKGNVYIHFTLTDTLHIDDIIIYRGTLRATDTPCPITECIKERIDSLIDGVGGKLFVGGHYIFATTLIVNRLTGNGICSELTTLERVHK